MAGQEQVKALSACVQAAIKAVHRRNGYNTDLHRVATQDFAEMANAAWIKANEAFGEDNPAPFIIVLYRAANAGMIEVYRADREHGHIDKNAETHRIQRAYIPQPEAAALAAWAADRATKDEIDRIIQQALMIEDTTREIAATVKLSQTAIVKRISRMRARIAADLYHDESEDTSAWN